MLSFNISSQTGENKNFRRKLVSAMTWAMLKSTKVPGTTGTLFSKIWLQKQCQLQCRVVFRLKMVAFKRYGHPEKCPQK